MVFALPGCSSWHEVNGTFSTANGQPLVIARGAEKITLVPGPLVVGFHYDDPGRLRLPGPQTPIEVTTSSATGSSKSVQFPAAETGLSVDLTARTGTRATMRTTRKTTDLCDCYEATDTWKSPCKDPTGASCQEYTTTSIKCRGTKPVEQGLQHWADYYEVDVLPPGGNTPPVGQFKGSDQHRSYVVGQEDRGSCVTPYH
jgi:hypothetical protein